MTKKEKQIKKMTLDYYSKIQDSIEKVAKQFAVKRVPLNFVDEILDRAELEPTLESETADAYIERTNKITKTLKELIHEQSDVIGDNKVSIYETKAMIKSIKDAFVIEFGK